MRPFFSNEINPNVLSSISTSEADDTLTKTNSTADSPLQSFGYGTTPYPSGKSYGESCKLASTVSAPLSKPVKDVPVQGDLCVFGVFGKCWH